jgi:hypothetical protein
MHGAITPVKYKNVSNKYSMGWTQGNSMTGFCEHGYEISGPK